MPNADRLVITGARVFEPGGSFVPRDGVRIGGDRFTGFGPADDGSPQLDAAGLWLIPGVYDAHTHITWNDFHAEDREARSPEERAAQTASALEATLRGGILNLRDAGGADAAVRDAVADGTLTGPRLQISIDMIGAAHAGDPARIAELVGSAVDRGAQWIKLVATAGSATPGDDILKSNFSREEIFTAVRVGARGGARVMVHTWGGDSADWSIESGAASIEHGIYLTDEQIVRAAAAGLTFVPTLAIYRHVLEMVESGELHGVAVERVQHVVANHETVVRRARDLGLPIAIGCDFTTPQQHGRNLLEIAALQRAGLTTGEALTAATLAGARLFKDADGGVILPGYRADAVLLRRDPDDPATFEDPSAIAAVIKDGAVVFSDLPIRTTIPSTHQRSTT